MMNKVWKKGLAASCLILVLVMQTVGCRNGGGEISGNKDYNAEKQEGIMGKAENEMTWRYQEFDVQTPDNETDILALREVAGKVWMITEKSVYFSDDHGMTWKMEEKKTGAVPEGCQTAAVSGEGTMAFAGQNGNILIQKVDGTQNEVTVSFAKDAACYTLDFANENTLLVTDTYSNIQTVDIASGSVLGNIFAEGEYHYLTSVIGDEILTLTGEGVKYYDYQGKMKNGNEVVDRLLSQDIADFNSNKKGTLTADLEGNGFYYACKRGLYHYALGGSITEQFIDGASNSMGDSECNYHKMAVLSDQTFLVVYRRGSSEMMMKKYAYAENSAVGKTDNETCVMAGELTVYTLYENVLLEQEINAINRKNPGCTVSVEVGLTEEAGLTVEDAVKTLNTEILAGTGPDVIILDGMSVEQYCESGLLLDLSGILREVESEEGIYEKIAYAYKTNEAVYAVPGRFQFPIMVGEKEQLDKITDLNSFVDVVKGMKEQHPEQSSIVGLYGKGLLEYMFDFCAPSWLSNSGEIETNKLKEFLEAVKKMEDVQKEGVSAADIEALINSIVYSDDNAELDQPRYVTNGNQSLAVYLSKSLDFSMTLLEAIQDTAYSFDGARGQSANVFIPKEIIGVNAKSQNQTSAIAFVKEFLSAESQSTFKIEDTAYPVNKTAFQKMGDQKIQTAEEWGLTNEKCKEGFGKIQSIIENLSVCCVADTVIREAVMEQGVRYLNEETTLDEAANVIEQKVRLHMAE